MADKSGIYQIKCAKNGHIYIGSSKHPHARWAQHRKALRSGKSTCIILQHAWTKHGEGCFSFKVIEECLAAQLEVREQYYINLLSPKFNSITDIKRHFGAEVWAKLATINRARAALRTHCPHGHEYSGANLYRGKKGEPICRACNAKRVSSTYASETPEQREARRQRANLYHENNRAERLAQMANYGAAHKEQKRVYDIEYRRKRKAMAGLT